MNLTFSGIVRQMVEGFCFFTKRDKLMDKVLARLKPPAALA